MKFLRNILGQASVKSSILRKSFTSTEFQSYNIELPEWKTLDFDSKTLPRGSKTNKAELMNFFELMTTMRVMEVNCGKLYEQKLIRGFLHLYVGEESVATGIEAGTTREDCIITAYRDHGTALVRGDTPYKIIAENISKSTGSTKGKGGSMHLFNKHNNYYGGYGIVGQQISLGTGIAFALKYKNMKNVCFALFGDGASNQGQFYESANMAGLWKLPVVYTIENNHFGMGTAEKRANHYTPLMGKFRGFPGVLVDGSNVFAVKEAAKFCKEYAVKNGPIVLEIDTYRYVGHSPSDPGVTYRNREEVTERRAKRDCIEFVKKQILNFNLATEEELKLKEKEINERIKQDVEKAINDPMPDIKDLITNIYVEEKLPFIRGVEYANSILDNKS